MTQIQRITSPQISSTTTSAPVKKLSGIEKVINTVKTFFKNGADGAVNGYNTGQLIGSAFGIIAILCGQRPSFKYGRPTSQLTSHANNVIEEKGAAEETTAWCGAIIGAVIGAIRGNGTKNNSTPFDDTQNTTEEITTKLLVDTVIPDTIDPTLPPQNQRSGRITNFIETYFKNALTGASSGNWLGRKVGLVVGLAEVTHMAIGWIKDSLKKDGKVDPGLIAGALVVAPPFIGAAKALYGVLGTVGGAAIGSIAHAIKRPEEKDVVPETSQPERA